MKKIMLLIFTSFAILQSCKKDRMPHNPISATNTKVDLVSSFGAVTGYNNTGGVSEVTFQIKFKVTSDRDAYFSPIPTMSGMTSVPGDGYIIQLDHAGIVDKSSGDVALTAAGPNFVGKGYFLPAREDEVFILTLVLKSPITHQTMYRMSISQITLYSDKELKNPYPAQKVVGVETPYMFID